MTIILYGLKYTALNICQIIDKEGMAQEQNHYKQNGVGKSRIGHKSNANNDKYK